MHSQMTLLGKSVTSSECTKKFKPFSETGLTHHLRSTHRSSPQNFKMILHITLPQLAKHV